MEILLSVALVAVLIWVVARNLRPANPSSSASEKASPVDVESQFRDEIDRSVQRDSSRSSAAPELRRVERKPSTDHMPATPAGCGKEAWSPRTQQLEVAGEWYRRRWPCLSMAFLPLPEHVQCLNPFGPGCVSLPPGSTIQVTREENYMEHLVSLLDRYSDAVVAASLRSVTEGRPRTRVDLVAVDIDGQRVGVLSATQTANFLPLVRRGRASFRGPLSGAMDSGRSRSRAAGVPSRPRDGTRP